MTANFALICSQCGKEASDKWAQGCPGCGSPLEIKTKLPSSYPMPASFEPASRMWQFRELLPIGDDETPVTLGEGHTPLSPYLANTLLDGFREGLPEVLFKVEYVNPTCSFKDRTASILLTKAKSKKAGGVVIDSSGNAAASISAYAARAGIACNVFVPAKTSTNKIKQIEAYGSKVSLIEGTRQDVLNAAVKFAKEVEDYYCGFQLNPYATEAYKTVAYELVMQNQGRVPEYVFLPAGTGGLLIGTTKGFEDMRSLGWTDRSPKIVGVQPNGSSPIVTAFQTGSKVVPIDDPHTVAEGLKIGNPYKGEIAVAKMKGSGGTALAVSDEEILAAADYLAKKCGLFVEPSGAVSFAGILKARKDGLIPTGTQVGCVLTGSGLKQVLK